MSKSLADADRRLLLDTTEATGNALTDDSAKSIACALVGSHLDYVNALFIVASAYNIIKLQRIQNTLVRIVTRQHR